MNTTNNTSKLVILGLMTGILLLMAYTPLGYLRPNVQISDGLHSPRISEHWAAGDYI